VMVGPGEEEGDQGECMVLRWEEQPVWQNFVLRV
jgi:hypothetical protein